MKFTTVVTSLAWRYYFYTCIRVHGTFNTYSRVLFWFVQRVHGTHNDDEMGKAPAFTLVIIYTYIYFLVYRTDAIKSRATRGLIRCSILIADGIVPNANEELKKRGNSAEEIKGY